MGLVYTGLGHLALRCRHRERTLDFYRRVFGYRVLTELRAEDGSWALTYLRTRRGQQLELFPEGDGAPAHLARGSFLRFGVAAEDTLARTRALREAGVEPGGAQGALTDPEGNEIELLELTPGGEGMRCLTLRCNHFARSVAFYRDTLDMPVILEKRAGGGERAFCCLRVAGNDYIRLVDEPFTPPASEAEENFRHYCVLVPDMAETARVLHGRGVELLDGGERFLQSDPARLRAELANVDPCGSLATGVLDAEGNWVEIMQYTDRSIQLRCENGDADS